MDGALIKKEAFDMAKKWLNEKRTLQKVIMERTRRSSLFRVRSRYG